MANLLGGSTIGGNGICSIAEVNQLIQGLQTGEIQNKFRKYEDAYLTSFSTVDQYITDKKLYDLTGI